MASVLISDDDDAVRHMLRTALERAGHQVVEGRNGAEGMSLYRSRPADLVITDVFMPGQDGIETIQQLRAEYPRSRILAISGGAVTGARSTLLDAELFGADATLEKPFTVDRLSAAVRELLDG